MTETGAKTHEATAEVTRALRDLGAVIGAPIILPWLDRLYDEDDVDLVLAAAAGGLTGGLPVPPATRAPGPGVPPRRPRPG